MKTTKKERNICGAMLVTALVGLLSWPIEDENGDPMTGNKSVLP